ncbi:hypothetical protein CTU88_14650 [Streptomyces sp. JV178]|uniref:hypothetical protein n=1 Tax=Streptomyces sp. JV178 TaxID=858632 RepID=UPI000C1B57EC|nr:hypothetical protein [Streptomyces sp. JV178]PIM71336.1 hypothetical protein CTU88_14650 [Streptomyces sp. JV178]
MRGDQLPDLGLQGREAGLAGRELVGEFAYERGGAPLSGQGDVLGSRGGDRRLCTSAAAPSASAQKNTGPSFSRT